MTTQFTPAQQDKVSDPLPLEKETQVKVQNDYRIWIGNMDPKLTEYTILELLKKFGKIKEFDFLFHKTGPSQGLNRGYSFVSYYSEKDAKNAIKYLDGKQVLTKRIYVKWAHEPRYDNSNHVNLNLKSDLVKQDTQESKPNARLSMIKSIEAKLSKMQSSEEGSNFASTSVDPQPYLHPALRQAKANLAAQELSKRNHPYRKTYHKKKR